MPEPAAESQPVTPSTRRLVIRVKISPKDPPLPPVRRRSSRGALLLILGAVALLLGWIGISLFRTDPTAVPAAVEADSKPQPPAPVPAPKEAAPIVSDETEVTQQPDAAPSPINEVIPDVPRSARETIRGTIIVSVRVTVGREGTVLAATAVERGPSRYFERLAIEAAKKWTFTPASSPSNSPSNSQEQRIMLVTFNFTRAGTTARANSLQ